MARQIPWREPAARVRPAFRALAPLVVVAGLVLGARASLATHYYIPSGSMRPTLQEGDRVLVDRTAYGLRAPLGGWWLHRGAPPRRGDVVVFLSPEDGELLVKRVAAVPGDVVAVRGGRIALGGRPVPWTPDREGRMWERLGHRKHQVLLDRGGGPDFGPLALGPEQFLLLGDHRGDSHDGRSFGPVAREAILGRVVAVFLRNGRPAWRLP